MTLDYLSLNQEYWNGLYYAPNPESFIFRFYGRILHHDYGIDGSAGESILDFGCGQGGALSFFRTKGFNTYGVDIAPKDLEVAKLSIPDQKDNFLLVDKQPDEDLIFFPHVHNNGGFDVVISIQTLDFLSNTDFQKAIKCIYNNMKPGAKIYASMNSCEMYYKKHSTYIGDGLWHVKFDNGRVKYDLGLNFTKDKDELREKFSLFKPIYLDHYDHSFREEGSEKRFTFFGIKE